MDIPNPSETLDRIKELIESSFATTIALKNKMPIEVLQRVLGHSSIKTTQIYAKVLQESVDEEFDRIDQLFS